MKNPGIQMCQNLYCKIIVVHTRNLWNSS